jgi:hypothetical protein
MWTLGLRPRNSQERNANGIFVAVRLDDMDLVDCTVFYKGFLLSLTAGPGGKKEKTDLNI